MGRATRWLKGFLGMERERRKSVDISGSVCSCKRSEKKRWFFGGKLAACRGSNVVPTNANEAEAAAASFVSSLSAEREENKREIAAAVPVLDKFRTSLAALTIQTVFRGHLARRALRALKGLVKFQALVRGCLVRKRAATALKIMQTLIKVQTEVCIQRARRSIRNKNPHQPESRSRKALGRNRALWQTAEMVEIGSCIPKGKRKCWRIPAAVLSEHEKDRRNLLWLQPCLDGVDCCCSTAHPMHSNKHVASGNRGSGDGLLGCKNYMANTASFNAKLRSPCCTVAAEVTATVLRRGQAD